MPDRSSARVVHIKTWRAILVHAEAQARDTLPPKERKHAAPLSPEPELPTEPPLVAHLQGSTTGSPLQDNLGSPCLAQRNQLPIPLGREAQLHARLPIPIEEGQMWAAIHAECRYAPSVPCHEMQRLHAERLSGRFRFVPSMNRACESHCRQDHKERQSRKREESPPKQLTLKPANSMLISKVHDLPPRVAFSTASRQENEPGSCM